jgi:hypothetical protein
VQICREKSKQTNKQTRGQQISVGVVLRYNLQRNNQQQRKQLVRYENRENQIKSTGPYSAIKNVIKKTTVNGSKYCYKPNSLAMLLAKYTFPN